MVADRRARSLWSKGTTAQISIACEIIVIALPTTMWFRSILLSPKPAISAWPGLAIEAEPRKGRPRKRQ
jgi:hypothetical protein